MEEETQNRAEVDMSKISNFTLNFETILQKIGGVFVLDFVSSGRKYLLVLLWLVFASAIYSISFSKDEKNKRLPSQRVFILRSCSFWILILALSIFFIMK